MRLTDDYYARWDGKNWVVETFYITKHVVIAGQKRGGKTATKVFGNFRNIADAVRAVAEVESSEAETLNEFLEKYDALLKRCEKFEWFEEIYRREDDGKKKRVFASSKGRADIGSSVDGFRPKRLHRTFARWVSGGRRK